MKKIILILSVCLIPVFAESVTVLNNVKGSKVYLNGIFIGEDNISKHPVEPGEYVVEVKNNGSTVFKESLIIGVGEDRVIDSNTFVALNTSSKVIDYGAKQLEEKRVKKATKGTLGLGANFNQKI